GDRIGYTHQLSEQRQVFNRRKIVIHADAVAEIADALARFAAAGLAEDLHFAFGWFREIGEDAKKRRLPRSVAAEQRHARSRRGFEGCAAERGIVTEVLPDAISRDRVHASLRRRRPAPRDCPCGRAWRSRPPAFRARTAEPISPRGEWKPVRLSQSPG